MRKNKINEQQAEFSILALDDDETMTLTLQTFFQASGYHVDVETDPARAIERIREAHYDILLLDFLMRPFCGDKVVSEIRKFNKDISIILLTGHKSMAPPIQTLRELDIQGYFEKSDRFDQLELLVESCAKSIRHMRTIQGYRDGLRQIVDNIPRLYEIQSTDSLMDTVLSQTAGFLNSRDLFLYCETNMDQDIPVQDSFLYKSSGDFKNVSQDAAKNFLEELRQRSGQQQFSPMVVEGRLLLPLFDKNSVFGVICSDISTGSAADALQISELYTKQASNAISNVLLYSLLNKKNDDLRNAYTDLQGNYMEVINVMRMLVDTRDLYTRGHSDRVAFYSQLVAHAMEKDSEYCERVRVAGTFHDIGKLGTADEILFKDTHLTPEEFEVIKLHPGKGRQILSGVKYFGDLAPIVEAHHEKYGGGGYPNDMRGEEIPEEARIICIADSFDAMTSNRHYRSCMSPEHALRELKECKGSQFDPHITDTFLDVFQDFDSIKKEIDWTYHAEGQIDGKVDL